MDGLFFFSFLPVFGALKSWMDRCVKTVEKNKFILLLAVSIIIVTLRRN